MSESMAKMEGKEYKVGMTEYDEETKSFVIRRDDLLLFIPLQEVVEACQKQGYLLTLGKPSKPQKPSVGRIVHYITSREDHRAAIITDVHKNDKVSLAMFSPDDGVWVKSDVAYSEICNQKYTWHWPEREE
jgi:hypothetical protein